MKRIIVLSLIVISVLLIAIVPAFAAEKRFDGVTLKVFANSHDPMLKAVKWSIPVVKEKFGIDILMDEAPYGTQFDKAMSAFVAHTGQYDVIVGAHQWTGAWADGGYVIPLDDYIKNDPEFDPSIYVEKAYQINSEWKGIQYALPFNMEGRLMFYRKDIFEKEGFKVPTNLEEWLNIVQSINNNPEYKEKGIWGAVYMYATEQGISYPFETYFQMFDWDSVKTENGFWDDNFQVCIDKPKMVEAFQYWQDRLNDMPPGVESYNLPEAYQFYLDGKAAMTEVWPLTLYGMLLDPANADLRAKTGTADIAIGYPMSGGWGIFICADSKVQDAAWEYIKFMTTAENDLFFFKEFGKGPSAKATYTDDSLKETYGDWLEGQSEAISKAVCFGKIATMSEFYGGNYAVITNQIMTGKLPAEEGVDKLIEELKGILERAGYPQQ